MANVNLVTNPSFETNSTGWTFTNATQTRDTFPNVSNGTGAFSCKMVASSAAVVTAAYTLTGLTIGKNYTVSFYVKISAVSTDFSIVPSIDGAFSHQPPLYSVDAHYVRRYMGFTATATSHVLRVQSEGNLAIGDTFWFDRVQANQDGLLPYFDGSYPYCTWSGTAHASTSTCTALDSTIVGTVTTDEVVIVNGLCLNTLAWNITTKSDRSLVPNTRGDNYTIPGVRGRTFVPNKPTDVGLYSLSMYILGMFPDGTIPTSPAMRAVFEKNFEQILRQCYSTSVPVPIYAWHPNGHVRTAQASLSGSAVANTTMNMGGRRAEVSLAFEILSGVWQDYQATTVTGTPSAAWSNQSLSLQPLSGGTAAIDDAVITVTGPITNPVVSNAVTNTSVTFTGTVPAGQTWVIDCNAWTSKVNGVSVLANTTHSGSPRFVVIDPGNLSIFPSISLSGSGTTSATNLSISAQRKHLVS